MGWIPHPLTRANLVPRETCKNKLTSHREVNLLFYLQLTRGLRKYLFLRTSHQSVDTYHEIETGTATLNSLKLQFKSSELAAIYAITLAFSTAPALLLVGIRKSLPLGHPNIDTARRPGPLVSTTRTFLA